ncbi:hypothetical protein V5O48_017797, partial [Marasmius crinis-equi]
YHDLPRDTRPAVCQGYPDFDIYPPLRVEVQARATLKSKLDSLPRVILCPYEYPDILVYPPMKKSTDYDSRFGTISVVLKQYPFFDLYLPAYPHFDLYPPLPGQIGAKVTDARHPTPRHFVDRTENAIPDVRYPFFNLYPAVYPHFDLYSTISGRNVDWDVVSLKIPAHYPAFELYSPVYPHFSLWPAAEILLQSGPSSKRRPRLTHAQLHREVFGSAQVSLKAKVTKTHRRLHEEVFPAGAYVNTPSGTYVRSSIPTVVELHKEREPRNVVNPAARSSSIIGRPVSVASPPRGLPPRPNSYRSSMIDSESPKSINRSRVSPVDAPSQPLPPVPQPLRRSVSSASASSRIHGLNKTNVLPPVDERVATPLARSSSLSDASRSRFQNRPSPLADNITPPPPPRKRDSLVLQRVRAINADARAAGDDEPSVLSLASKFPMPPRPPLPSRPS